MHKIIICIYIEINIRIVDRVECKGLTPCLAIFFSILRNKHYLLGL